MNRWPDTATVAESGRVLGAEGTACEAWGFDAVAAAESEYVLRAEEATYVGAQNGRAGEPGITVLRLGRVPTASTGWRRVIGSPKLQTIFHKRAFKYRSLLRKMTYKDKGSYESSPSCTFSSRDGAVFFWTSVGAARCRAFTGNRNL